MIVFNLLCFFGFGKIKINLLKLVLLGYRVPNNYNIIFHLFHEMETIFYDSEPYSFNNNCSRLQ